MMKSLLDTPLKTKDYPKPYKINISQLQKMYETHIIDPEKRLELINGEIIMMVPIGFKHMKTINKLNGILNKIIIESQLNFIVSVQNPIKVSEDTLLYPDLVIFSKDIYKNEEIPTISDAILIIEVSDTTLEYDKNVKLPIYAKANAKEVWIINLKENIIEKYTSPSSKFFKQINIYKEDEKIDIFNNKIGLSEIL